MCYAAAFCVVVLRENGRLSLEKADAIVIRQVDFSESSRVVTFFSREYGKFSAMAKGARRIKGPFDAALDLLSRCRVVFIKKSSGALHLLTEARLTTRFRPEPAELPRVYGGYYVAELLNGLTEDLDVAPTLFDLAVQTLEALSRPEIHPSAVLIRFEVLLLREIGLLPNLSECSVCGVPVGEAPKSHHGQFAHWVTQGGLLCAACRKEEYAGTSISASSISILRQISSDDAVTPTELSDTQAAECHRFAVSAITSALGRKPLTLRYIRI